MDGFSNGANRYRLQAGVLVQLDRESETVARIFRPLGTRIVQAAPRTSGIILREDYFGFPQGASNLYLIDYALNVLWRAELPTPTDAYANPVLDHGNRLECGSWECWWCIICPETGRILSKQWTK